jgi:hypothetical protein
MKFKRSTGLLDSGPRKWIDLDKRLPVCPLCKKPSLWETATSIEFPNPNRIHFRCPNCMAVFSTSVYVVQKWLGLASAVTPQTMRIETVGNNTNLEQLVGQEQPLTTLQEWARQTS